MSIWVPAVVLLELAVASMFYFATGLGGRKRATVLVLVSAAVLALPLVVPPTERLSRLVVAICAALLSLKLFDVSVGISQGVRPSWPVFIRFLTNPFCFVLRRMEPGAPIPTGRLVKRLAVSLGVLFGAWLTIRGVSQVTWPAAPFVFDHMAKSTLFFVGIVSMFTAGATAIRLAGGVAPSPIDRLTLVRSPADFWRRYNRCLRLFFYEDVFRYTGKWRSPVRATLVVFALSGLLHEYAFSLAAGHLQGYQSAFFLLQGLAVSLTLRARPRGFFVVPSIIATIVFLLLSSLLFFASFHDAVRFYTHLP